ncbi:Metallothionein-like protein [Actinidia chinensis var. chinensis]|uniref:Metallothionein-like protein n=1 Tax=Actinidia chinensis var. chinensis TaxID=1590841 RepID=A0A2R6QKE7_ACTCC|nr:Metallothionein-like protein [Actinidia chinensis var. chinensis]
MSCCGGSCGCSSGCKCGNGCGGCKMHPDMTYSEKTTTETLIVGVAPQKTFNEGSEMVVETENCGCPCGSSCSCDPCKCNK